MNQSRSSYERSSSLVKTSAMDRLKRLTKQPNDAADQINKQSFNSGKVGGQRDMFQSQYRMSEDVGKLLSRTQSSDNKARTGGRDKARIDSNNNKVVHQKSVNSKMAEKAKHAARCDDSAAFLGGSTNPNKKQESLKERVVCICNRPKTYILCTICGYSTFGHIRMPCYAHLRDTYLLDMVCCPRCNSGRLMEVVPSEASSKIN